MMKSIVSHKSVSTLAISLRNRRRRRYTHRQRDRQREFFLRLPSLRSPTIRFCARHRYVSTYIGRGFIADILQPTIPYLLYYIDQPLRGLGAHPRSYGRMRFQVVLIPQRSSRSVLIPQRSSCSAHPTALILQRSSCSAHPVTLIPQQSSHIAHSVALIPYRSSLSAHPVRQGPPCSAHPVAPILQCSSLQRNMYHTFIQKSVSFFENNL